MAKTSTSRYKISEAAGEKRAGTGSTDNLVIDVNK